MKKNYLIWLISVVLLLVGESKAQEQQKKFINYQGVARDAENEPMEQEALTVGIALRFGSPTATIVYEESHAITTDANGVFSLQIGNGNVVSGIYDNLPWHGATFLTVSLNGQEVGTLS